MFSSGRWVAAGALALSLSGCTVLGLGAGAAIAVSMNGQIEVQQGLQPRTSVGKSMALGAVIGLAVDIGIIALSVNEGGGSFGH